MPKSPVGFTRRDDTGAIIEVENKVRITDNSDNIIPLPVDGVFDVNVIENGIVSTGNTTSALLGANGVFTGTQEDILDYAVAIVSIQTDTVGTLEIQFRDTQVADWHTTDTYTIDAIPLKTYQFQGVSRYFRLVYTNGDTPQTHFHIITVFKKFGGVARSHRLGDTLTSDDDAGLVKAILSAERLGSLSGNYHNVKATDSGNLMVSLEEIHVPQAVIPTTTQNMLFDGKMLNRFPSEILESVGTGDGTFADNGYTLAVDAGEWRVLQSKRFAPYFSGNPQKVELTFDGFAPEVNVEKRLGYFSSSTVSPYSATYDGFWLLSANGTITLEVYRAGVEKLSLPITQWSNYDNLGIYQDMATWDNFSVVEFEFLWLGGAYFELRIVGEFGYQIAHRFNYTGTEVGAMFKSPCQPVRYEIRSTTGTGNFRYLCTKIATGSRDEAGFAKAVDNGVTPVTLAVIGTKYPVLAIRKGTSFRDNPVQIKHADLFLTSNDSVRWTIEINPTLSAPLTYGALASSAIEFAVGNGTITVTVAGTPIPHRGYMSRDRSIEGNLFIDNFLSYLSGSITGVQDEYVLCGTPLSTNVPVYGVLNMLEG